MQNDSQNSTTHSSTEVAQALPVSNLAVPLASSERSPIFNQGSSAKTNFDILLDWAFTLGFSSVFIINSLTAILQPASFLKLIQHNFVSEAIGHYQIWIHAIAVNDMILGLLILSRFKKPYVYAWAGVWLAAVTFFKVTSL
jgi:hypothetical protein